ncbi:hypothetical protein [Pyrobaculum sp.]|uniref:hypothetical protein n=1 Tax=Pyrobaculum sp. TaxID=2004705 RepID=UPI003D11B0B9
MRSVAPYLYATRRFGSIDFIAITSESEGGTLRVGQTYTSTLHNEASATPNLVETDQWFVSLSLLSYATRDGDAKSRVEDRLLPLVHKPFRDIDVREFKTVVVDFDGPHLI